MMTRFSLVLALALGLSASGFAATKDSAPPDREMLRMMDLLREMDMIKQIDMLQDMHNFENTGAQPKDGAAQKSPSSKPKETR
jgi:hypothetical protein